MNEPNVVNREVILEQVADKGLFVICIRSVHLFTESFVSVFYLIIRDYSSSCQLLVPVPPEYWTFKMASLCYFLVLSHGLALFAVPRCYSDSISNFLIFPLPADHSWQRHREQKSWRGLLVVHHRSIQKRPIIDLLSDTEFRSGKIRKFYSCP